jgi:hypothetical protein
VARIGEGAILTLERVERLQSGVYQCTAENNVGEPVTVDMRLDVLCEFDELMKLKSFPSPRYSLSPTSCVRKSFTVEVIARNLSVCYRFITQFSISI